MYYTKFQLYKLIKNKKTIDIFGKVLMEVIDDNKFV